MNSIEKTWRTFLKECINNGEWVVKDDGDKILEILDNHCFIPNVVTSVIPGNIDISTSMFLELIEDGAFNVEDYPIKDLALQSYVMQLDDPTQIYLENNPEGKSFIYTYPERLYNVKQATRDGQVVYSNQIDTIINRLRKHSGSNRAVANLYMCSLDENETHIPCLQFVGAYIRDNKLSLHILFRSNDLYSAFVSNMFFLQYLGLKITEELKNDYPSLVFDGLYYNSVSLHIYQGDFEQAQKVIRG